MIAGGISWRGLAPEQERFMAVTTGPREKRVTWTMVLRLIGGYVEPWWLRDRRPQPLRSRRSVEHFRALLRRAAVTRLRLEGRSFRQIGRELGISQVAAWKLWHQVVADTVAQAQAEHKGALEFACAVQEQEVGNGAEMELFRSRVQLRVGMRVTRRFLGD